MKCGDGVSRSRLSRAFSSCYIANIIICKGFSMLINSLNVDLIGIGIAFPRPADQFTAISPGTLP